MARGVRLQVGRYDLDQTYWWQLAGRADAGPDPLFDDPARALDRVAQDGYDTVAITVSWARLEPDYELHDAGVLDRYRKLVEMARSRGLEPLVLLGVDWPWWLGEELWLTPGSPERFQGHVRRVVAGLAGLCRRFVLHQVSSVDGWVEGAEPPGRWGALADAWAVADNAVSAQVLGYQAAHELADDVVVAVGLRLSTCYEWHRLVLDLLWSRQLGVDRTRLDAWVAGRRRAHDHSEPATSVAEWTSRAALAALSPYGVGRFRRPNPRRAVNLIHGADCTLAADAIWLEAGGRRRPWDAAPADLARWCDDQRRLTPGVELWLEGQGPADLRIDVR